MAITGGFGMTMDLERGALRRWTMGRDGVRRWADDNRPVDEQTPLQIVQGAIDAANCNPGAGPHEMLRIVTLRMDDALRVLDALTYNDNSPAKSAE